MNVSEHKQGVVPRLRFPEFRDAGPWEFFLGSELFSQVNNRDHHGNLPVLAITQEYGTVPRDEINYYVSVTKKSLRSYKIVEPDDFIISLRSFQGGIEHSAYRGICSPAYVVLRSKKKIVPNFYKHYFKTATFIRCLTRDLQGIRDGKMISYQQFGEVEIPVPSNEEQQKIADCLASLDELIQLETQKLDVLKSHKKGLMQQLFPREGETTPRLRFPEFRDAGPWEVKRLGEVAQLITERAGDNDYVLLSVTSGVGLVPQMEKFGREIAGKQKKNYYVIRPFDFAYNKSATKEYPQGYVALYKGNEPAAVPNSIFTCFRPDLDLIEPHYLDYLFSANFHGRWLAKVITVGARAHGSLNVDSGDVLNIPLPVPKVLEQQKIADCLSSLDELITLQAQKLDALKAHKKGLMQQLFPQEISA